MKEEIRELLKETVEKAIKSKLDVAKKKQDHVEALSERQEKKDLVQKKDAGVFVARVIRSIAASKNDPERAMHFAKKAYDDSLGEQVMDFFKKSVAAGDFSSGGFMIPPEFADDIIDLLRPRSVVRQAGVPSIPMPNGTITLPKATGDVTAYYVAEGADIPTSQPSGGQITLTAKKLAALVPISNDLLRFDVGPRADAWVRNSLVSRIAIREDRAFLRGNGANDTPKGIRYQASTTLAQSGTTASDVENDVFAMITQLESNDVVLSNPALFMSPRSKHHLAKLRDANGNLIFPEIRDANPNIMGIPVFVTTNIPDNLGAGGNESEVYLVNVDDLVIGEAGSLEITASADASYVEGGTVKSAFSKDETVIRAVISHDFAALHQEAIAVLTGVTWGV